MKATKHVRVETQTIKVCKLSLVWSLVLIRHPYLSTLNSPITVGGNVIVKIISAGHTSFLVEVEIM